MYKQGLQAPTLPNLVISRWICSSMINFKYFLKEASFLWHLSMPSLCYWWCHLFIQLAKKQCDLFWQRLFSVTTPEKFVLPAGVHPQHFCICWGMFFLFWVLQTGGSLLSPCGCFLDKTLLLHPLSPHQHTDEKISYLQGISGNHRWNQQKRSSFLQKLKVINWKTKWHRCVNRITWLLAVSHQRKDRCGETDNRC